MKYYLLILFFFLGIEAYAQKWYTRKGNISFSSTTPLEVIEAISNEASALIDPHTGEIAWLINIKSFRFEKNLMQQHFNENFMESNKYPKASFSGKILNPSMINWKKDGSYPVRVEGNMLIHGITRVVNTAGLIVLKEGQVNAHAVFTIRPEDYGISVPRILTAKIAKDVEVRVNSTLYLK